MLYIYTVSELFLRAAQKFKKWTKLQLDSSMYAWSMLDGVMLKFHMFHNRHLPESITDGLMR